MLPTAGGAAASDGVVCYKWRLPCALQRTADLATNGRRPCYQWPATLLQGRMALLPRFGGLAAKGRRPVVASFATSCGQHAYHGTTALLPEPSTLLQRHIETATKVHHCCYHGLSALLQTLTKLLLHRLVLRRWSLPAEEQRLRSRMRRKSGEEDAHKMRAYASATPWLGFSGDTPTKFSGEGLTGSSARPPRLGYRRMCFRRRRQYSEDADLLVGVFPSFSFGALTPCMALIDSIVWLATRGTLSTPL